MADTVYYKYGSFTFLPGEVIDCRHTYKRDLNKRSQATIADVVTHLKIRALGCTPTEIWTREDQIYNAFTVDHLQFGMYLPDGTLSKLMHSNTGWWVVQPPIITLLESPTGGEAEYATKRDIEIEISSRVLAVTDEIVEWYEEYEHVGVALAQYAFQNTNIAPVLYELWPVTTRQIIQKGYAIGLEGWVIYSVFPEPLYPSIVGPTWFEHTDKRKYTPATPITIEGAGTDVKRFFYKSSWEYVWETTDGINVYFPTYAP